MNTTISAPDLGAARRTIAAALALLLVSLSAVAWTHTDRPSVVLSDLA